MYMSKQLAEQLYGVARVTPPKEAKPVVSRRPKPMSADALVKKYGATLNDWQDDFGSVVVHSK